MYIAPRPLSQCLDLVLDRVRAIKAHAQLGVREAALDEPGLGPAAWLEARVHRQPRVTQPFEHAQLPTAHEPVGEEPPLNFLPLVDELERRDVTHGQSREHAVNKARAAIRQQREERAGCVTGDRIKGNRDFMRRDKRRQLVLPPIDGRVYDMLSAEGPQGRGLVGASDDLDEHLADLRRGGRVHEPRSAELCHRVQDADDRVRVDEERGRELHLEVCRQREGARHRADRDVLAVRALALRQVDEAHL
eukprot:scaffold26588_cov69-Phaeocystis_antarctica.AAC.1